MHRRAGRLGNVSSAEHSRSSDSQRMWESTGRALRKAMEKVVF